LIWDIIRYLINKKERGNMSTRSNIAIEDPKTKKVKVIYVHSDGYPYGVGKCLVDHYNMYDLAKELFNYGDASYLGDTIDECSFYGRDWDRDEEPAKTYRDEWMFMNAMKGDVFIEYIYLFKDGQWNVSTGKYVPESKLKDSYDGGIGYFTKFESVKDNKEYIKYKDKHEKHAEVKMISKIGDMLKGAGFNDDDVVIQGGNAKKAN
jgi:hypothetical protein